MTAIFNWTEVNKINSKFFDLIKVSKQPSMHCLKHNIAKSKKITIIQS